MGWLRIMSGQFKTPGENRKGLFYALIVQLNRMLDYGFCDLGLNPGRGTNTLLVELVDTLA